MSDSNHLYILWTNADPLTSEKMVFMYGTNAMKRGWWGKVTIIIWGATAKLAAEDARIQAYIKTAQQEGVFISACKACADQLGATEMLEGLGVEVIYWGEPLTKLLKEKAPLLNV